MLRLIRQLLLVWVALLAALASVPARSADPQPYTSDIDIYSRTNTTTELPNVLIILDNTANWSPMFTREIKAMVNALNGLEPNKFRVGLMMFTQTQKDDSGTDGGYVRAAIRDLSTDYKDRLNKLLSSLDVNDDKSNSGKAAMTMAEAYYYFAGKAPVTGRDKNKTDYLGNTYGTSESKKIYELPLNALPSRSGTPYRSPVSNACAGNYIIFISNGATQDSNSDNTTASNALSAAYTAAGQSRPADITGLSPNGSQVNVADEWARFMKGSAQAVTTFTLDVDPVTTGQGPGWSALLKSMATHSGGEYFKINSATSDGNEVKITLDNIFNQIQAVDSVFASASLPVSVNSRGTYLNQVFMGVFRPDGSAKPRWRGNLKQYKFGYDPVTDTVRLEDSQNRSAVGPSGFIAPDAVSFWTEGSTFWTNQRMGTPLSASDSPDGEVVEKGGVAQRLRTKYPDATAQATRKVYTCIACANGTNLATTSATQFTTGNTALTASLFGVSTDADKNNIISWVRGANNVADDPADLGPGGSVTVRPSIHGDVLHSRPAVVNYGTTSTTQVYVFYGANDGTLRAVNGNQTGTGAGEELWAFIPSEHLGKFKRQRDNTPEVRLSTTNMASFATATPRDYFVDGPIGVYQKFAADGSTEKVHIYAAMRRGGRVIYALDVTNISEPKLLWKKSGGTGTGEIPVLGQTWSEPKVARLKGYTSAPVIIMGAGYDSNAEDSLNKDTAPTGTQTMGNAVLVLDAFTGELLKQFNTERSVPSDVALVDGNFDGYVDRAYVGDVGGNLYRIDFEINKTVGGVTTVANSKTDWNSFKLAALSSGGVTRKFFFPPDVVLTPNFTAVLAGTGNRENPLGTSSSDAFYTIYDTVPTRGVPADGFTPLTPSALGQVGTDQSTANGCFIPMASGEKVVTSPVTVAGNTFFSTNKPIPPEANSCKPNLGEARAYSAPLFCKVATSNVRQIGGLPPSPVSGIVTITYTNSAGETVEKRVPFLIGGTGNADDPDKCKSSSVEGCKVKLNIPPTRARKYWFMENPR